MEKNLLTILVLLLVVLTIGVKRDVRMMVGALEDNGVKPEFYDGGKKVDIKEVTLDIFDNYCVFKKIDMFLSKGSYGNYKGKWAVNEDLLKIERSSILSKYFRKEREDARISLVQFVKEVIDKKVVTTYAYTNKF